MAVSTTCTQVPAPHALQAHMASEVFFPRSVLESYTDRHYHSTARAPEEPLVREFCPETSLEQSTRRIRALGRNMARTKEEVWRARKKIYVANELRSMARTKEEPWRA